MFPNLIFRAFHHIPMSWYKIHGVLVVQRTSSTLVWVKACCRTAPSHYMKWYPLVISEVPGYSPPINFTGFPKLKGDILLSHCPSVDRIVSALYLQQYLPDPFHICSSYQATSEDVFKFKKNEILANCLNMQFWLCLHFDLRSKNDIHSLSVKSRSIHLRSISLDSPSWRGVYCLSVFPSLDRLVSALYIQQYLLGPSYICSTCQATSEGV